MKIEKTCIQSQKGFSLIEVLFASAVILLLVVGFLGSSTALQFANQAAYERSIALQDANQVIERMRNTAVSGTFPGNVTAVYPNNGAVSGFTSLTSEAVSVTYTDRNGDGNALTDNPLDVTVTVTYLENGRRNTSMSLRSLITQR